MSKVVIIKNNGKVQQIRQYAEESYNTGEIRYYSTQKMNYSLRKSRSVQKGKKRKRLHFC